MLKALIKTRLLYMFKSMFGTLGSKNKQKGKNKAGSIALGVVVVYVFGMLIMFFVNTYKTVAAALIPNGLSWLYFSLSGVAAALLCFIGSIFIAQTQLFESTDNEMLLSMPVPPSYIVFSRFLSLGVMNYAYSLLVTVPAIVVYGMYATITPTVIIGFILGEILMPMLPLVLSCIVGYLIALVSSKMRNKNFVSSILMIIFFIIYMLVFMNIQNYITELISKGKELAAAISSGLPPFFYYGDAIVNMNGTNILMLALWCIIPLAVIYFAVSKSFIKIATAKKGFSKKTYKTSQIKQSGQFMALFKKELSRFFSLPMYVFNSGFGVVMIIIAGGYLAVQGFSLKEHIVEDIYIYIAPIGCAVLSLFAIMTTTTSVSLSLEGKGLWVIKSMPIDVKSLYNAKILVNLVISVPFIIITDAIAEVVFSFGIIDFLLILIVPILAQIFAAVFGLFLNILMPRFDWINEMLVIKQSGSVLISVFGGMAAMIVLCAPYFFVMATVPVQLYVAIAAAVLLIADIVLYRLIMTKGVKAFAAMG